MAFSDSDDDVVPELVANYDFVDSRDEAVSFAILPFQWRQDDVIDGRKEEVFLRGTVDNGLQKIYKHVTMWKFDLSAVKPEISVLSKENVWFKLQKPRKIYEDTIRSILITVHSLHFVKNNPDTANKLLWDYLGRTFSLYDVRPSQNDLLDHLSLIGEVVKRDNDLGKSKFLLAFLEDGPRRKKLSSEDLQSMVKPGFIVDDNVELFEAEEDGSDEDYDDVFDSVCAICDNGGELLCCEGKCLRSFHPTYDAGEDLCESLGLTEDEVIQMPQFYCKNCQANQHQCFICGKLGSSDKSSNAEVFRCVAAGCGRFYHSHCVAKLIEKDDSVAAIELQKKIATGQSFTCPRHKCYVCKKFENKEVRELHFATCRRCPKSYHRKCLPKEITFENDDEEEDEEIHRAWEGLLPCNRILIYCLDHEIDEDLKTPVRNHIKFPGSEGRIAVVQAKKKKDALDLWKIKQTDTAKKRAIYSEASLQGTPSGSAPKKAKLSSSGGISDLVRRGQKVSASQYSSRKAEASKKLLRKKVVSREGDKYLSNEKKISLGERLYEYIKESESEKHGKMDANDSEANKTVTARPALKNLGSTAQLLDADSERRILALMKDAASSISLEAIKDQHKGPSTHAHSAKHAVDRTITQGKLEGAVEALRIALQRLDEGGSVEDAQAVCGPEVVSQIFKWKSKLRVYLAPFLHGMRYTSFGRHFTKVDKLQEIVDKLHWYVKEGDMIVDFCCGANDFSWLMKNKLEETGKKCSYKNYDIIHPKNDFNFEKRDWMTVRRNELPKGSQLIMGLNPPFGVKASLANQFINKALDFKPKLVILIVPPETERLDRKRPPYDLIWEDEESCSGKSFYLPGSVDVNDKQMEQWNLNAPVLYLWSRQDWTSKHKAVAQKHQHLIKRQGETVTSDNPVDGNGLNASMLIDSRINDEPKEFGNSGVKTRGHIEDNHANIGAEENLGSGFETDLSKETPRIERHQQESDGNEKIVEDDMCGNNQSTSEVYEEILNSSILTEERSSFVSPQSAYTEMPLDVKDPFSTVNLGEQYTGQVRPRADALGYRSHINEKDGYRDARSQVRLYGLQGPEPSVNSNYLAGFNGGFDQFGAQASVPVSYGHLGPGTRAPYNVNTSVLQHYEPQLNGMNQARLNTLLPEFPMMSRNGIYDPGAPQAGSGPGSFGFAPGPHHGFSNNSSSGWLDE